jgi:hypothetical protein
VVVPFEDYGEGLTVFGLLTPESDFDLDVAYGLLCDEFADLIESGPDDEGPLSIGGNDISIDPENLGLFVVLHEASADVPVASDAQELAAELGAAPAAADVARCTRRIEFGFSFHDPRGEIFPEFQRVLAVLRTFHGVIFLDPRNPVATLGGNFTPPPRRRKK